MIKAVVYVSQTGHTKKYAELLGEKIGLPIFELQSAVKKLEKETKIIYLGWLMAGTVQGYKKAAKCFDIKAVCGVGMSGGNSQITDMKKANHFSDSFPIFYLQGGFELDKLHGIYRLMMKMMKKAVGKEFFDKQDRTPEVNDMLALMLHGENLVSVDNLNELLDWYRQ